MILNLKKFAIPTYGIEPLTLKEKLKRIVLLYFITLALTAFSVVFIYTIGIIFGYYDEIKALQNQILRPANYYTILLLLFIGPVVEELIFRFYLSFNKFSIVVSVFFLLVRFAPDFSYHKIPTKMFLVQIIIAVFFSVFLYFLISQKIIEMMKAKFLLFFWISISLFALVHIRNFSPLKGDLIFLYILMVIPQFFMGWMLGYARVKYGFKWGCLLHALINLFPALMVFLAIKHK